jgi:hypothetical protein
VLWFSNARRRCKPLLCLSRAQIRTLTSWFFQHIDAPVPGDSEQRQLACDLNLPADVVGTWCASMFHP